MITGLGLAKAKKINEVRKRKEAIARRKLRKIQKGGAFPLLAAAIPALMAAGKAAGFGIISGAAGFGIKKALDAMT